MNIRLSGWQRCIAIAAATGMVLGACAVAAVPRLLDTDAVRRSIEREISALVGGEVRYDMFEFRFFPGPRAEFHRAAIRIPGAVEGRSKSVEVRIALVPLLMGSVRPSAIRVVQPVLQVHMGPAGVGDPFSTYRAVIGPVVDAMARDARGLTVSISGGRIEVESDGRKIVSLSEVTFEVAASAEGIVASASCTADLWSKAQGSARITAGSLAGSAKVQVDGLRGNEIFDAVAGGRALAMRTGMFGANLTADTDGRSTLRASLTVSTPQLAIARGSRTVELGAARVALDVARDGRAMTFSIRGLEVGEFVSEAAGSLRVQSDGTAPAFLLQVPVLDLARLRDAALALASDWEGIGALATLITGGTVRGLTLVADGADFTAMMHPTAFKAQAEVETATISVPAAGIVVRNGSGRFLMADGTLQGSGLAGDIGRSSFSSGALAVAFLPAPSVRSLRGSFKADLTDALAISRRLLEPGSSAALAEIEALQGHASATIDYEAGRRRSPLVVELKGIRATGRYRGAPFPLAVSRGDLRYSGEAVSVSGLAGVAGGSTVNNVAINVALGRETSIRAAAGDAVLVLDEIYPLIAELEHARPVLGGVKSAAGTAAVRLVRLSGAVSRPASLDFDIAVRPQQMRLTSAALPGVLTLAAGSLSVSPRTMRLEQLRVALLDAGITGSGAVEDYAAPGRRVSLSLSEGTLGKDSVEWARERWKLPADWLPRAPVTLSAGRLEWTDGTGAVVAARGTASIAASVQADFDIAWRPGLLDLRRLALKDADSDAAFHLQWSPATAEVGFSGRLHHRTLERSLAQPPRTRVMLDGDFRASIDRAEPWRSSADGTLEIEGLDLREHGGVPVTVDRLSVDAAGRTLRVRDGTVRLAGERLTISGTAESRGERIVLDARVSADALDGAALYDALRRGGPGGNPPGVSWNLPVGGRIAVAATSVAYGETSFRPFHAIVSLAPNRVVVDATETRLCGMTIPFTAALAPGGVEVSARLTARNESLEQAVSCLAGRHLAATGTYDLDADFSASGPGDTVLHAARGTFSLTARAGRIHRAAALSRALAVDEVASRAPVAPAELMASGLAYQEIALVGSLEAGRVRLDHGVLDSSSLGITVRGDIGFADGSLAMQGLVAPFDTHHRALRRVPVLGRAVGASLVVVPISIGGSLDDPEVKVLRAAAVGATLLNLMTARFLLPIDLFDPAGFRSDRDRERQDVEPSKVMP